MSDSKFDEEFWSREQSSIRSKELDAIHGVKRAYSEAGYKPGYGETSVKLDSYLFSGLSFNRSDTVSGGSSSAYILPHLKHVVTKGIGDTWEDIQSSTPSEGLARLYHKAKKSQDGMAIHQNPVTGEVELFVIGKRIVDIDGPDVHISQRGKELLADHQVTVVYSFEGIDGQIDGDHGQTILSHTRPRDVASFLNSIPGSLHQIPTIAKQALSWPLSKGAREVAYTGSQSRGLDIALGTLTVLTAFGTAVILVI